MTDDRRGNAPPKTVRCAIYTRKSTEEGLQQEFNTLDAQRDVGEAFVASQRHEGWVCLPDRYDDGGFTGGNMDRPALRQLLDDIQAKKVDCVVVYKVDRLSRSLLDFAQMMQAFERHDVAFASVTQQLNTKTSMGRLVLNVLLSFAQFEREMIGERTRDKIAATRRRGTSSTVPRLGYDVVNGKLVVNPDEAQRVREIFDYYLEHRSISGTVRELRRRGWTNKVWITRQGQRYGGGPIDVIRLKTLLSNVAYIGQVRHKDAVYPGKHEPIVAIDVFRAAEQALESHAQEWKTRLLGGKHPALLRGLMHCAACHCRMVTGGTPQPGRRYSYYVCHQATRRGWCACPSPSVSGEVIDPFVVAQVERLCDVPAVVQEVCRLSWQGFVDTRALRVNGRPAGPNGEAIQESRLRALWARFPDHWNDLLHGDRCRLLGQLIERIDYHGPQKKVLITFKAAGVLMLAKQFDHETEAIR